MAEIDFDGVTKVFGDRSASRRPTLAARRRRRVHGPRRTLGLRQDHRAAHAGRPRGDHLGHAQDRRCGREQHRCRRTATSPWSFRTTRSIPHMTVAKNIGFALKIRGDSKAEIKRKVDEAAAILRLDGLPRAPPEGALGRAAPARRDGSSDRAQPAGLLDGRAALQPRRPSCASRCVSRSRASSACSASRRSTSRTTRSRR